MNLEYCEPDVAASHINSTPNILTDQEIKGALILALGKIVQLAKRVERLEMENKKNIAALKALSRE